MIKSSLRWGLCRFTGPGSKVAKELVDGAPENVKEGASKAEAEEIANKPKTSRR